MSSDTSCNSCQGETNEEPKPDRWVDLCKVDDVPQHGGHFAVCEKRGLAVFKVEDEIRVIDDTCPHAGASLASGPVDDGCVICPWHGWSFDTKTGKMPGANGIGVRAYESRVIENTVQVRIQA